MRETDKTNLPRFIYPCEAKPIFDSNLNKFDKILYIVIITLSSKRGYCFANNKYLAKLCDCTIRNVQYSLLKLKKYNYIFIDNISGKRIIRNYMTLVIDQKDKILPTLFDEFDWLNN